MKNYVPSPYKDLKRNWLDCQQRDAIEKDHQRTLELRREWLKGVIDNWCIQLGITDEERKKEAV